jgi:hypothetical protein
VITDASYLSAGVSTTNALDVTVLAITVPHHDEIGNGAVADRALHALEYPRVAVAAGCFM